MSNKDANQELINALTRLFTREQEARLFKEPEASDKLVKALTRFFAGAQQARLSEAAHAKAAKGGSPQALDYEYAMAALLGDKAVIPPPRRGLLDLVSPFTLVVAFMTIVFGVFGLFPSVLGAQSTTSSFLDVC